MDRIDLTPVVWERLSPAARAGCLRRPVHARADEIAAATADIIARVRAGGDDAVRALTARFDGVAPDHLASLEVTPEELAAARTHVAPDALRAVERALANIEAFHRAQETRDVEVETMPGVACMKRTRPIERVGLYVPGGTAPLVSTALMLAAPARAAGCPLRVLCTPPRPDGSVDPHILVAAALAGVHRVFKIGGAQAVAAMAFGTATVPAVDKIFGPGNAYVTEAKLQCAGHPDGAAFDLPAGPSEVLVIADATAEARFVAVDLLSQAEHDPQAQVVLVTDHEPTARAVLAALTDQLAALPRRDIARQALAHARVIVAASIARAVDIANQYAPEHLILQVARPRDWIDRVTAAGSVFLGPWTPEAVGDYASGTNHVLPTYGYARAYSGLSVAAFTRAITFQELSPEGLRGIGPTVEILARLEGLDAHRQAVSLRLAALAARPGPFEGDDPSEPSDPADPAESAGSAGSAGSADPAHRADNLAARAPAALARPAIRRLRPYRSARGECARAAVYLDANEAPEPPTGAGAVPARDHASDLAGGVGNALWHRYPEPQPAALVAAFADLYGVPAPSIFIGRGADDAIDALLRTFCEAGTHSVVLCPPTYGMYRVSADIQGARVLEVPLAGDFEVDAAAVLRSVADHTRLIFLCSPNNPTGNCVPHEVIERLCQEARAVVVVDEAYVEFCPRASVIDLLDRHRNLVVLRTLSKAWGLAGVRCGVALGDPEVIGLLHRVRAPYPLSRPAIAAALDALARSRAAERQARVAGVIARRDRLAEKLSALPDVERVFPSQANFLLVEVRDPAAWIARCRRAGILIRDRSGEVPRCVRITVGSEDDHRALLTALAAGDGSGGGRV